MTNKIEVTKRLMHSWLAQVKMIDQGGAYQINSATLLENAIEEHLVALRQERDDFRNQLQALTHNRDELARSNLVAGDEIRRLQTLLKASKGEGGTSAQDSTENVASDAQKANALTIILGALIDSKRVVADWSNSDVKAKKAMYLISDHLHAKTLVAAQKVFEKGWARHEKDKYEASFSKDFNSFKNDSVWSSEV